MTRPNALIAGLIALILVLVGTFGYVAGGNQGTAEQTAAEPSVPQEEQIPAEAPATLPSPEKNAPARSPDIDLKFIPAIFHGEWNAQTSQCGRDLNDSRLKITERTVQFYESLGSVTRVKRVRPHEILVSLSLSGEGETWSARYRFAVTSDGKVLTDKSDSEGLQRFRCA